MGKLDKELARLEGLLGAKLLTEQQRNEITARFTAKGHPAAPSNGGATPEARRKADLTRRKMRTLAEERAENARLQGNLASQEERDARFILDHEESENRRLSEMKAIGVKSSGITRRDREIARQQGTEQIHARRNARLRGGQGVATREDRAADRQAIVEARIREIEAQLRAMGVDPTKR